MSVIDLTELDMHHPGRSRARAIVLPSITAIAAFIALVTIVHSDPALGQVRIHRDGVAVSVQGAGFVAAKEGQELEKADGVRTDRNGAAQIDFFDGSLARMDHETSVVVGELAEIAGARRILLEVTDGRSWHRVRPSAASDASYQVRGPMATASALGTTFIVDGRQAPVWYYLGEAGRTEIDPNNGDPWFIGRGDCVRLDDVGMRTCTEHESDALRDDWVDENRALDQQEISSDEAPTVSPSITQGGVSGRSGSGGGSGTSEDTSSPPRSRAEARTDSPEDEAEEEEQRPRRTDPPTLPPRDDTPDDETEPPPPETPETDEEDPPEVDD